MQQLDCGSEPRLSCVLQELAKFDELGPGLWFFTLPEAETPPGEVAPQAQRFLGGGSPAAAVLAALPDRGHQILMWRLVLQLSLLVSTCAAALRFLRRTMS